MAKKKETVDTENIDYSSIASLMGGEILEDTGQVSCFIDTGVLALNWICSGKLIGGGIPGGNLTEIFGNSASGKTLFATNILRGAQTMGGISIFMDVERSIGKDFAVAASHVDPNRLIVVDDVHTLESVFNRIHKIINVLRNEAKVPLDKPIVIVYDSIAASPSEREFAETTLDMETATKAQMDAAGAGSDKPGERAKICSKELRKLMGVAKDNNVAVVIINQLRSKIGVMFGDPNTNAGGGRALEYYCNNRLQMFASKHIKDDLENVIGVNVKIVNKKNRCTGPFKEAEGLRLFFDNGIDPFGGLLEVLLKMKRIEPKGGGGIYKINPEFTGGKEVTFKSSKEKNSVPVDVLLEYPSLVDGEKPEDIQYYLNMFGGANKAAQNELNETEFKEE